MGGKLLCSGRHFENTSIWNVDRFAGSTNFEIFTFFVHSQFALPIPFSLLRDVNVAPPPHWKYCR